MKHDKIGVFVEMSSHLKGRLEDIAVHTNQNQGDLICRSVEQYLNSDKMIQEAEAKMKKEKEFLDTIRKSTNRVPSFPQTGTEIK